MVVKTIKYLIYGCLFLLIPATLILLAVHLTVFKPYDTINGFEQTGVYGELQIILPEALQESEELLDVTSDERLNEIFKEVVKEHLTVNRISEILSFIEKDMWDYILDKDVELEAIDLTDIRTAFLEKVQRSESMQGETIYQDKFIDRVEWVSLLEMDQKRMDKIKKYYEQMTVLVILNGLMIGLLIGLSFFLATNRLRNLKWLSSLCLIAGFTVMTAAVLFHIIGLDWIYTQLELSGVFSGLTDNIHATLDRHFLAFLSALIGFAGFLFVTGLVLYGLTILKSNRRGLMA
ncbi:hypothetical protein [Alkalihalobacillus sp. TS-13]|uniref:hypothetical protein n=1 Tax=Alkalihalobacillus sp. TS-13 TaxID=2842455 RepID=UPI001C86DC80|nr:hypothetical protein [Alkalihalobacillus sp. TS-13]